jgi:glycosyltransferase involved in cell wall biosynthesis
VTGCFNEEDNVILLYERVKKAFEQLPNYRLELTYIDNASTDKTVEQLRAIAAQDKRVKVIINTRNFGPIRSGYHAFIQAPGDAVVGLVSDLQEPPELIPEMVKRWENGAMIVMGVKTKSKENKIVYSLRTLYYRLLNYITGVELIEHFNGFGLYDQRVMTELRRLDDCYPYVRGLVSELGFKPSIIEFEQPKREHGKSKINLFALYDIAMLGLTTHSIAPMRIATISGLVLAFLNLMVALYYLIYKLVYWSSFDTGLAPLVIGMFVMFSVILVFIGLLGEYVHAALRQIQHRPLVIEKERINFD